MLENIRIEKMQVGELEEVAQLLTDTFETNPAYSLIFDGTHFLREGLFWLFKTNLFLINRRQVLTNVVKKNDSGKIIGTFSILPPGGVPVRFMDYLRIELPWFIRKFGFRTLSDMMGMDDYNKGILTNSIKTKEYHYLSMVVIKSEYQGKGIGSYVMRTCLDELSRNPGDCRVMGLTTQLPENVVFYSRLGFEKLDDGILYFKGREYYNCNMKYHL